MRCGGFTRTSRWWLIGKLKKFLSAMIAWPTIADTNTTTQASRKICNEVHGTSGELAVLYLEHSFILP